MTDYRETDCRLVFGALHGGRYRNICELQKETHIPLPRLQEAISQGRVEGWLRVTKRDVTDNNIYSISYTPDRFKTGFQKPDEANRVSKRQARDKV